VIGDLTTSVTLDDWNITGIQNMFSFSCLTLSKDLLVFNQPNFIWSGISAELSEVMHGLRYGSIGL
jgi:hypothetical protein